MAAKAGNDAAGPLLEAVEEFLSLELVRGINNKLKNADEVLKRIEAEYGLEGETTRLDEVICRVADWCLRRE